MHSMALPRTTTLMDLAACLGDRLHDDREVARALTQLLRSGMLRTASGIRLALDPSTPGCAGPSGAEASDSSPSSLPGHRPADPPESQGGLDSASDDR